MKEEKRYSILNVRTRLLCGIKSGKLPPDLVRFVFSVLRLFALSIATFRLKSLPKKKKLYRVYDNSLFLVHDLTQKEIFHTSLKHVEVEIIQRN